MPPRRRILVVDDEPTIAEVVSRYLEKAEYDTRTAGDGNAALAHASTWHPDLVVLDLMIPGVDGLEVMRRMREAGGPRVAVILLTAKGEEADRIDGLRLGADDYVVKPFSPAELVARVDAELRRSEATDDGPEPPLFFDGLQIDPSGRRVTVDGTDVPLTQREFDLLLFLARHPGQVFTRDQLMEQVWRFFYSDTSTVTVHIRRLRAKIEPEPAQPRHVETVWGVGYRFRP
jgi:DNA-binding response OmpR family regulator